MRKLENFKKEAEQALKNYNKHSEECLLCGSTYKIGDYQEDNICQISDLLYDIYNDLRQQIKYLSLK